MWARTHTLPVNEGHVCAGVHMFLHATSEVMEYRVLPTVDGLPCTSRPGLLQVPLSHPFTENMLSSYSLPACP